MGLISLSIPSNVISTPAVSDNGIVGNDSSSDTTSTSNAISPPTVSSNGIVGNDSNSDTTTQSAAHEQPSESNSQSANSNVPFSPSISNNQDPSKLKYKPEVVVLCDSVGKYLDPNVMCGRQRCFKKSAPNLLYTKEIISRWSRNDSIKKVIIHVGINDLREGNDSLYVANHIQQCIDILKSKFRFAVIVISHLLVSPDAPCDLIQQVKEVNNKISQICKNFNCAVVIHNKLSKDRSLFYDNVHITREATNLFVANIVRARPIHNLTDSRHTFSSGYQNSSTSGRNNRFGAWHDQRMHNNMHSDNQFRAQGPSSSTYHSIPIGTHQEHNYRDNYSEQRFRFGNGPPSNKQVEGINKNWVPQNCNSSNQSSNVVHRSGSNDDQVIGRSNQNGDDKQYNDKEIMLYLMTQLLSRK